MVPGTVWHRTEPSSFTGLHYPLPPRRRVHAKAPQKTLCRVRHNRTRCASRPCTRSRRSAPFAVRGMAIVAGTLAANFAWHPRNWNATAMKIAHDAMAWFPSVKETVQSLSFLDELNDPEDWHARGQSGAFIIALSNTSGKFKRSAAVARNLGFDVVFVAASRPQDFITAEDQIAAAMGCTSQHKQRGTMHGSNPLVLANMLSHERALRMLALSKYAWGMVLEDDIMLHPQITPHQAVRLIRRAAAKVDEAKGSRQIGLYIGSCGARCGANVSQSHFGGLPTGLLRGTRCSAFCCHAYAVTRNHAKTFYHDVVCGVDVAFNRTCGARCSRSTCQMDSNMRSFFTFPFPERESLPALSPWRQTEMWIVGGGLAATEDGKGWGVGIILQNRSWAQGTTALKSWHAKRFHWPAYDPTGHVSLCNMSLALGHTAQGALGTELGVMNDAPRCSIVQGSSPCSLSRARHAHSAY